MSITRRELLKLVDYYIQYNYVDGKGIITISWLNEVFVIKWNKNTESIICSLFDDDIKCNNYVIPSLIYLILRQICDKLEYPYEYVDFQIDGVNTNTIFYEDLLINDINKAIDLFDLTMILYDEGLRPELIELAETHNILPGFNTITHYYLYHDIN